MNKKDFVVGQVYKHSNGNIFMWGGRDSKYYLNNNNARFAGAGNFRNGDGELANEFDRRWLLECIKANKFISKDKVILNNYEIY